MQFGRRTYLDYNATSPILACARDAMMDVLDFPNNPSSVHTEGRYARKVVEQARKSLAELVDWKPANVVFCSGATEAANHLLTPFIRSAGYQIELSALLVGATEHPCVLKGGRFPSEKVRIIPVTEGGILCLDTLKAMLKEYHDRNEMVMVAVQFANNETGVLQPLGMISELVHEFDSVLVVDAVQALGKHEFSMQASGADFAFVSSHKIGGPQGAGAIIFRDASISPAPLLVGGGQEQYHRAGTENVSAIHGFGVACAWHKKNLTKNTQISALRDSIEEGLRTISHDRRDEIATPYFFGEQEERLCNTSCFSVTDIKAETALMALDLEGIAVSSGSACTSGKVNSSHVLEAMGANKQQLDSALRVSLGWNTNKEDAEHFLGAWKKIAVRMATA